MISLQHVSYEQRLCNLTLQCETGQFVHLIGENGAGKSTLLSVLAGVLVPSSGKTTIDGEELEDLNLEVFSRFRCYQRQQQDTPFGITVAESLQFFAGTSAVPDELERVLEVKRFLNRPINKLSGGEARRVYLLRVFMQIWMAISNGKGLILLDEPTQGLDYRHQHLLMEYLQQISRQGNTVVISHHDLNLAWQFSDWIWLLKSGSLLAEGEPEQIMTESLLSKGFDCRIKRFLFENTTTLFQSYLDKRV